MGAMQRVTYSTTVFIEAGERGEPGEFDRMSDDELRQAVADRAEHLRFVPIKTQH
jgi:hypothetical protein